MHTLKASIKQQTLFPVFGQKAKAILKNKIKAQTY